MNMENVAMNDVLEREECFHDEWAKSVDPKNVQVDALEMACTMPETRFIIKRIGKKNLKGKKILEIGCGLGEASVYFAKQGAEVTATDLSSGMVNLALKVAEYHKVKINVKTCSADDLPFVDDSFDIVYAANVLHHVDMDKTLAEIKRVLKNNGTFICWDPIKYNPAINIYRRLASGVRTVDEHPIDIDYVKKVKKTFKGDVLTRGFWFLTNLIFVKYYFIDKLNPSKVRYWKYVIDDADNVKKTYSILEGIDNVLLRLFPIFKWWCWNMVIIAKI